MAGQRSWIAIIDDEPDITELFSEGLRMAGFKTITLDNVQVPNKVYQFISFRNNTAYSWLGDALDRWIWNNGINFQYW